jgi:hypothetical protein
VLGKVPFTGTFTCQQAAQSSTAREMRGYEAAIAAAAQKFPELVRGASVLLTGDNQGAISAFNNFRSPVPEIHESLQRIFNICSKNDFNVQARWTPRENLAEADELSKRPDASDWGIDRSIYESACEWFGVKPNLDLFASGAHHVSDRFVSQFFEPGCMAVHAYGLDWAQVVGGEVAWVFPPVKAAGLVISLMKRFKVNALLCIQVRQESNEAIQMSLIEGAHVSQPFMVPRASNSCHASGRVPQGTLNPAFLGLGIYRIRWI